MVDPIQLPYKDDNQVEFDSGNVAVEYGVSREEQDEWAVRIRLSG